jgi:CHAD domain-containing protein
MQTALQKYFAQRVKNLFNHLHDFDLNGDEGSLHDYRVEMKKLRAIIKFFRKIYPKQKLKKPANLLRSIFEISGEIREYQILVQWLVKHDCKVIEQNYFPAEKLHEMMEHFRFHSEKYAADFTEIIKNISDFAESTNEILPEQYFAELNARVEKLCVKNLSITDWHELRKLIKQRIYSYNWFQHDDTNDDPLFGYYNKLQEQIGHWHDLEMIKNIFSQKQIYLSQDIEVQKEFNVAWEKLSASLKYREKMVEEMLAKQTAAE